MLLCGFKEYMRGKFHMKKNVIYFLVLLVVCSLSLTLVPGAFSQSQTQNVKVVSDSYYIDSLGYLVVVGEVQNIGSDTIASIMLTGIVTSPDGSQTNSYTTVWVSNLIPQQKAPFYMEFYPPQNSNSWYLGYVSDISLTVAIANATSGYQYPDLTITSSSGSIGNSGDYSGAYVVNGIIQNTGTQAATNVTVVGTFFNSTGAVVGVGYTDYLTPTVLNPSKTTSFQIAAFDLNQTIVPASMKIYSYSLLVQTQEPILQGTAPLVTPYPSPGGSQTPIATSSPSSASSPGQGSQPNPTGSSQSTQLIYAVVIVITIVAVAAALMLLKKRSQHT
jgi:hypothetical protein